MNKSMKMITLGFISALMAITVAAPITAHAGTLTIYNKNCKTLVGLKKVRRVTVHVYDFWSRNKCTNKKVTVGIGQSKTITVKETRKTLSGRKTCKYSAEPMGTDDAEDSLLAGDEDTRVTCKSHWLGCQCVKN